MGRQVLFIMLKAYLHYAVGVDMREGREEGAGVKELASKQGKIASLGS